MSTTKAIVLAILFTGMSVAIGVSTGTYYTPANAATAEEIRRVCEELSQLPTLSAEDAEQRH